MNNRRDNIDVNSKNLTVTDEFKQTALTTLTPSDQTLCENLIDLAGDRCEDVKPCTKDKGTHSDEVRIMEKVLGPEVRLISLTKKVRLCLS